MSVAKGQQKAPLRATKPQQGGTMSISSECKISGCKNFGKLDKNRKRYLVKGYCAIHYQRLRRTGDPLKVRDKTLHKVIERKNKLYELLKIETEECINWPFPLTRGGYGYIKIADKTQYTHRIALEHRYGAESGTGKMALHKPMLCHNRACINYRHLYWGTVKNNARDSVLDNTSLKGERHPKTKLTNNDVIKIYTDNKYHKDIAAEHGVGIGAITSIKKGENWSWLTKDLTKGLSPWWNKRTN